MVIISFRRAGGPCPARYKKTGLSDQGMTKKPGEFSNLAQFVGLGGFQPVPVHNNRLKLNGQ